MVYDESEDLFYLENHEDVTGGDENEEDEDEDDDDEGISFEKYAELSAKVDPYEDDESKQKEIIEKEGFTWEDWDFYKGVWSVQVLTDPDKIPIFAQIYAKFSINK